MQIKAEHFNDEASVNTAEHVKDEADINLVCKANDETDASKANDEASDNVATIHDDTDDIVEMAEDSEKLRWSESDSADDSHTIEESIG